MTLIEAMKDERLFAAWFRKPEHWVAWRAFIAALFGLQMGENEFSIFTNCTKRSAQPSQAFKEAFLVVGRRGGKSFILALIAVFLACFEDYQRYLAPGERGTVMIIAADRKQARTILRYISGLLHGVPMLKEMILRETADGFDLLNGVTIEVGSASYRRTRGYTFVAILADELAFWSTDELAADPDRLILDAVRPGMATIPNSMLLCASSPYAQRGVLHEEYSRHFGRENENVLVWQADTRTMNPSVPQAFIDKAYEDDPANAAAEYGAQFRSDLEAFITRQSIEKIVVAGRSFLPPEPGLFYTAFVDPSGGSADSMTLAIAHRGSSVSGTPMGILDYIGEWRPPFNPTSVVKEIVDVLRHYNIHTVTGDRYSGCWVPSAFIDIGGITYIPSDRSKSQFYLEFLPLVMSPGKIELLDSPRLITQLCSLERRVSRSGKDSIDHPPGPNSRDDVANSVSAVLVNVIGEMDTLEQYRRIGAMA